jgi:RNA polymerase sigma-70 factor (ECF subfamily)
MTEEEVARVRAVVNRAVRAVCPGWLSADAEDFAQTATIKILELSARGSGPSRELNATYLWRTAHSVVIDGLRRRVRRPEQPLDPDEESVKLSNPGPGPEARLLGARLREAIRDCLSGIVAPRRRAVSLHLLGHSVPEIARLCTWPPKRADNLVYRGLADLRDCLRSKGYHDEG